MPNKERYEKPMITKQGKVTYSHIFGDGSAIVHFPLTFLTVLSPHNLHKTVKRPE